jgi:hypothetical protein
MVPLNDEMSQWDLDGAADPSQLGEAIEAAVPIP